MPSAGRAAYASAARRRDDKRRHYWRKSSRACLPRPAFDLYVYRRAYIFMQRDASWRGKCPMAAAAAAGRDCHFISPGRKGRPRRRLTLKAAKRRLLRLRSPRYDDVDMPASRPARKPSSTRRRHYARWMRFCRHFEDTMPYASAFLFTRS